MKKILASAMLLASMGMTAFAADTKTNSVSASASASTAAPQIRIRVGNGRRIQRRQRVVVQTRNVRQGRNLFRETYRTTYFANGRVVRQLVSRVRVGRY